MKITSVLLMATFLFLYGEVAAQVENRTNKCQMAKPLVCPVWDQMWSKRSCKCMKRPQCKRKCKNGWRLHPYKFCKCVNNAAIKLLRKIWNSKILVQRASGNAIGAGQKWARCAGMIKKCTMYQKWNWSKCTCERKDYCKRGCAGDQVLHPGYQCKCVDSLQDLVPQEYLKDEDDSGCGKDHYYSEEADYCVSYSWCPKWYECGAGRKWSQPACDCVGCTASDGPDCGIDEKQEDYKPLPDLPGGGATPNDLPEDDAPYPPTLADENRVPAVVQEVPVCDAGYEWNDVWGYCFEIKGTQPKCQPGMKFDVKENACVWAEEMCKNLKCNRQSKKPRFLNGRCQCFTNKAWCKLQKCKSPDRMGFSFGRGDTHQCRCLTLREYCSRKKCGQFKDPFYHNGRCGCYTRKQACALTPCPMGQQGVLRGELCQCMTAQAECSSKACPSDKRGFFWKESCMCRSKDWICGLKQCGQGKSPALFRGQCVCLLNKQYCSRKSCPAGMEGRWKFNSCRCFWKKNYCSRKKCHPEMEGRWSNGECSCFYKYKDCAKGKECLANHFAAWYKNGCRCFNEFDPCAAESTCPQCMRGVSVKGNGCRCQRIPDCNIPPGLCKEGFVWSQQYWGCVSVTCGDNQVWSKKRGRCVAARCGQLQFWSKKERRCLCSQGAYWDPDTKECTAVDCGVGYLYDPASGSCVPGKDEQCVDPNMIWNQPAQRCVCKNGYYFSWQTKQCRPVNCGPTKRWNMKLKFCESPVCTRGMLWSNKSQKCKCKIGEYIGPSDKCELIYCQADEKWSVEQGKCVKLVPYVPLCPEQSTWDSVKKRCWCNDGWYWNTKQNSCQMMNCLSDEKWSWKWMKCIPRFCPKLMSWDAASGKCKCVPGRYWSTPQRRCVPAFCQAGMRFSFLEEKCVVVMSAPCPNNKHIRNNNGVCECKPQYKKQILGRGEFLNDDTCQVQRYSWCPKVKRCPGFLKKWDKNECKCKDIF